MRFLWVDAHNNPAWHLLPSYGFDGLFFALNDPMINAAYLEDVRSRGYAVGLYVASNWPGYMGDGGASGAKMAEQVNWRLNKIMQGGTMTNSFPKVQFNIEQHDPTFIRDCLVRWRELQPKRDTSWTPEGMQGGWMSPEFVKAVVDSKVRVVPQCYNGAMTEVWSDLAVVRDLTKRGFPESIISPFYDAKHLPRFWDGYAFIQHRIL